MKNNIHVSKHLIKTVFIYTAAVAGIVTRFILDKIMTLMLGLMQTEVNEILKELNLQHKT